MPATGYGQHGARPLHRGDVVNNMTNKVRPSTLSLVTNTPPASRPRSGKTKASRPFKKIPRKKNQTHAQWGATVLDDRQKMFRRLSEEEGFDSEGLRAGYEPRESKLT